MDLAREKVLCWLVMWRQGGVGGEGVWRQQQQLQQPLNQNVETQLLYSFSSLKWASNDLLPPKNSAKLA